MKTISERMKYWFVPVKDNEIKNEIHTLNIRNIYYVSLSVGIVQLISLAIFFCMNFSHLNESSAVEAIIRVGLSVVLCLIGFLIAGWLRKKPDTIKQHSLAVRCFIGGYVVLMIIWGMYVSVYNYINYQQLLTFYTVTLLAVLILKINPIFTTVTIFGSYLLNYLILNYTYQPGLINPYNYLMLAALSIVGAIMNYRLTVNYISQKNKAAMLNDALEIIANHDSITRLQNRYALNQNIPDYLGKDICIALGDINRFKSVNDTYGHRTGDDVLKAFSDILMETFEEKYVYCYGGDEFLIINNSGDIDTFKKELNQVNEKFSAVKIENLSMQLRCSFGVLKAHAKDPKDFFGQIIKADQLLYQEKDKIKLNR